MRTTAVVGAGGIALLLVLSSIGIAEARTAPAPPSGMATFSQHIDHIIFMMQENRAYDNFYGTYCLALSKFCPSTGNGIPRGTCVPLYPGTSNTTCERPYALSPANFSTPDLNHDWWSSHGAINGGHMNGFYAAEGYTMQPFGHYNGSTIPVYWDLAEQYGLADNFFSSALTYSLSNHWFMVGPSAPGTSVLNFPPWAPVNIQHRYLNQSNRTVTIENQLVNSTLSWKYYDFGLSTYQSAINNFNCCGGGGAYDLWDPLAARHESYGSKVAKHFVDRNQFFTDAANGALPNISWIIPTDWQSDHAPANLTDGQNWSASVVNALEGSPEWNSSVLFITWDEYGGWFDHVRPPRLDHLGDSLRVPLLAIGPWVQQGVIDHAQMDFDSVLALMEQRFGLACIGPRDCNATLPLGMFNFSGGPRAPITILYYGSAEYPMRLQSWGMLPRFDPTRAAPPPAVPPPPISGFAYGVED